MGSLGTFTKGAPLSKADISETGFPFILYGELYTTYKEVTYHVYRQTDANAPKECFSNIGDVIIPTSGETPEEIATATCVMVPNVILGGDLNIYRNNAVDGRIISYIINHKINKCIAKVAQGKSVVHIKADDLSKMNIKYPEKDEQAKIINFLWLIDKRIEKQRQLVESLKKYKRGLLFSIFTSIQTSVKLEQISTYHSSNLTLEASQTKGNFALYDANGICSNIDTYMHDTDYVAIIKDGSGVGKLQYCKQKSSHIGTLGSLTSQSCSPYYLYTALQIIDFTKYITGMAIPHIYYKDYKKCDIPYPDRNSQNLIENTFKSIDKIITKSILNLEKLKLLKAGLLQQMFI